MSPHCSFYSGVGRHDGHPYIPSLDCILLLQKVCSTMRVLTVCNAELFIQGINHFVQIADNSDEVPDLAGKSYSDFKLNKKDWDKIALVAVKFIPGL